MILILVGVLVVLAIAAGKKYAQMENECEAQALKKLLKELSRGSR